MDINLNSAKCLKTMSHWGYDQVHNVCNGAQYSISWGALDYIGNLALVLLVVGIAAVPFGIVYNIIRD